MLRIYDLHCEYRHNPVGIDVMRPRLFWKLASDDRGDMQGAYQVQAAPNPDDLLEGKNLLWDSGMQTSDQSIHVVYEGPALRSRQRCYWRVRVWEASGQDCGWSDVAYREMGLLHPQEWEAQLIRPDLVENPQRSEPCPLLRREFTLSRPVHQAHDR